MTDVSQGVPIGLCGPVALVKLVSFDMLRSLQMIVDAWLRVLSSPPCVGHLGIVVYVHSGGVPNGLRAS